MSLKSCIWVGVFIGSMLGTYLGQLLGAGVLSFAGAVWSTIGALVGIWAGFKFGQSIGAE